MTMTRKNVVIILVILAAVVVLAWLLIPRDSGQSASACRSYGYAVRCRPSVRRPLILQWLNSNP